MFMSSQSLIGHTFRYRICNILYIAKGQTYRQRRILEGGCGTKMKEEERRGRKSKEEQEQGKNKE